MRKTKTSKPTNDKLDDLLPEYKFDYGKARSNRFAVQPEKENVTVALDPDVSRVFTNSESVNSILRALIENMPQSTQK